MYDLRLTQVFENSKGLGNKWQGSGKAFIQQQSFLSLDQRQDQIKKIGPGGTVTPNLPPIVASQTPGFVDKKDPGQKHWKPKTYILVVTHILIQYKIRFSFFGCYRREVGVNIQLRPFHISQTVKILIIRNPEKRFLIAVQGGGGGGLVWYFTEGGQGI